MKVVVVGGQARKVGKTAVVAGLIRGLDRLAWTAVKISHHGGASDAPEGKAAEDLPRERDFLCCEERDPRALRDTSRFLAAGARRALWLRVREGKMAGALPALLKTLAGDEHVIIESNSIVSLLQPAAFLLVMGDAGRELKASAQLVLPRVDALVAVEDEWKAEVGAGRTPFPASIGQPPGLPLADKPVFRVSPVDWANPALCRFVAHRLASADHREILVPSSPAGE